MGGQNSQDSILERRSLVWNDNGVIAPAAPPSNYTEIVLKGKFYPRGCRGMIEQVAIYCVRTAAGTLTLRLSPHPVLGPLYQVTITPGAAWAWVTADLELMWNYDSLFIWVYTCDADVSWGYDAVQPFDGHWSQDAGATWEDMAIRPFIRVVYTGETPGDVPVSGIINNIPIPAQSSFSEVDSVPVPQNVETIIVTVEGAGYCDYVEFYLSAAASSHMTTVYIYCDGVFAGAWNLFRMNTYTWSNVHPMVSLLAYAVNGVCAVTIQKRFEFRRSFEVRAENTLGPQTVAAEVFPTLIR